MALAALVYGRTLWNGFVFDDETYISANPWVLRGLTWESLRWAFSFNGRMYWHPVTWLSLMLDVQVLGPRAWGFHLVNLLFHVVNILLFFKFLLSAKGRVWPAFLAAALFCVHPMHVESVAWATERKDVLAAFFWMLAMLAHLRFVRGPSPARFLAVFVFMALGLMAKPILVTLPFVLLLLDFWPLGRCSASGSSSESGDWRAIRERLPGLAREKLPLLGLALASVAVSLVSHPASGSAPEYMEWVQRLANALRSVFVYLARFVWPSGLAVHHPFPADLPPWHGVAALAGLAVCTWLALAVWRSRPYVLVGWLWFAGTLVPTLKLYQMGLWYEYADRFAYIPYLGLYLIVAYGLADLARHWPGRGRALGLAAGAAVLGLAVTSWVQCGVWRDEITLYTKAIRVHPEGALAHNNLGSALLRRGDHPEAAEAHFREALRLKPGFELSHRNLAVALTRSGRLEEALPELEAAIQLKPDYVDAHADLGVALLRLGRPGEAEPHLRRALEISPELPGTANNLGMALLLQDRVEEAVPVLLQAVRLAPGLADAHDNLGVALARLGRYSEAVKQLEQALAIAPGSASARANLERVKSMAVGAEP